jgi:hypothetical protein
LLILNLAYDFYIKFDFLFNNGTSIFPSWEAFSGVQFVAVFSLLFTPVFTYIAILKYRLYYIDVVITAPSSTVLSPPHWLYSTS